MGLSVPRKVTMKKIGAEVSFYWSETITMTSDSGGMMKAWQCKSGYDELISGLLILNLYSTQFIIDCVSVGWIFEINPICCWFVVDCGFVDCGYDVCWDFSDLVCFSVKLGCDMWSFWFVKLWKKMKVGRWVWYVKFFIRNCERKWWVVICEFFVKDNEGGLCALRSCEREGGNCG